MTTVDLSWKLRAQKAESRVRVLEEAAKGLVDKLNAIHADERYKSVWALYVIHGGYYQGPFYKEELETLVAALTPQADTPQETK